MSSWTQAGIAVPGAKVLWTGLVGNGFSPATVRLAMRRANWTWPVRLTGATYVIFFVMVLAGFHNWLTQYRRQRRNKELEVVTA